jgi:hypothetical protein
MLCVFGSIALKFSCWRAFIGLAVAAFLTFLRAMGFAFLCCAQTIVDDSKSAKSMYFLEFIVV